MDYSLDNFDEFWKKADEQSVKIIPQTLEDFDGFCNLKTCSKGFIAHIDFNINAVAHLSTDYYIFILPTINNSHLSVNGLILEGKVFLSPFDNWNLVFNNPVKAVIIGINKDHFENHFLKLKKYSFLVENIVMNSGKEFLAPICDSLINILDGITPLLPTSLNKILDFTVKGSKFVLPEGYFSDVKREGFKYLYDYLVKNICNDLPVSEMASFLSMSRRDFEKRFKEFYGYSPSTYYRSLRAVEIRWSLLNHTYENINSLLKSYSIQHAGHFGQFYKRIFQETMSCTAKSVAERKQKVQSLSILRKKKKVENNDK